MGFFDALMSWLGLGGKKVSMFQHLGRSLLQQQQVPCRQTAYTACTNPSQMNVVVVGLDNSGKTTIIERLKPKALQSLEVAPTVGFTVDEFSKGSLTFTVFDMSGAGRYRPLWEQYYRDAHAVIFVVDSADRYRMVVAKDEMDSMLANKDLKKVPILFFANKKDLPTAMSPVDIAHTLRLEDIKDRPLQICPSDALTGEGVDTGTQWLAEQLMKKR